MEKKRELLQIKNNSKWYNINRRFNFKSGGQILRISTCLAVLFNKQLKIGKKEMEEE